MNALTLTPHFKHRISWALFDACIVFGVIVVIWFSTTGFAQIKPLYENNLEAAALGKLPADLLVLDGQFAVKEERGNKFIELPGAPIDNFGIIFGPSQTNGLAVSARIRSTAKGQRTPAFGVGVNGVGGYRLLVAPGKRKIELYRGETLLESVPCVWESGSWTWVRLQLKKVQEGQWKIEGKVWKQGQNEPKSWTISADEKTPPTAGKSSLWGLPYASTPIQFDDLSVSPAQ